MAKTFTPYTEEEKAQRKQARAALVTKAKELQANGFVQMLAISQAGNPYSSFNQCMIAMQEGKPGQYGGFRGWLKAGRRVKKGGKSVLVYAPVTKKQDSTQPKPSADSSPEVVGICLTCVFHIDQTEPVNA